MVEFEDYQDCKGHQGKQNIIEYALVCFIAVPFVSQTNAIGNPQMEKQCFVAKVSAFLGICGHSKLKITEILVAYKP